MNRKDFISSAIPFAAVVTAVAGNKGPLQRISHPKVPPYLKPGGMIGICCPSGYISLPDLQPAVNKLKEWGYQVRIGKSVGLKDFSFGGTDQERANDLQAMLDDTSINAILFTRGGYGAVRIIDRLDFSRFIAKPKWITGFSDATVFHAHLNRNFGVASIHSKMCNSFPADWTKAEPIQIEAIESIRRCWAGDKMQYSSKPDEKNRTGNARGVLVGGNLSVLESLAASISDVETSGRILFLEEVDEYLYSIDRMMWSLKRSGKLNKLRGLIIGGMKVKPDDPGEEFGRTIYDIVNEVVKEYTYPVCFDFPVGHQKNNFALKCGVMHHLTVTKDAVTLTE